MNVCAIPAAGSSPAPTHPSGPAPRAGAIRYRNTSTVIRYAYGPPPGAHFPSGRWVPASMPTATPFEQPGLRIRPVQRLQQTATTSNSSWIKSKLAVGQQHQQRSTRVVAAAAAAAAAAAGGSHPPAPSSCAAAIGTGAPAAKSYWDLTAHGVVSVRQQDRASSSSSSSSSPRGPSPWGQLLSRVGQVVQYQLMLLFRLPTWGKLLALVLVGVPIMLLGSAALVRVTDMAWGEAAQLTFYVLQNVPGADITGFSEAGARLVLVVVHLLSLYTFATLVGLLTEDVRSTVEEIRCGNFPIPSRDHTVILDGSGDTNRVLGTLQKVLETRDALRGGAYAGDIAILSTCPKDELDKLIADVLPKQSGRVVTRYGNPVKVADLERVAALHARTVLLLAPDGPMGQLSPELQQQLCLTALRSLHTSSSAQPTPQQQRKDQQQQQQQQRRQRQQRVVVETEGSAKAPARDQDMSADDEPLQVTYVSSTSSAYRVAVQCAVQPGLAAVFDAVFCRADDASIRLVPLPPGLEGRTFAEARRRFRRAVVCGLLPGTIDGGSGGAIQFSPPDAQLLRGSDALVLLAAGPDDCFPVSGEPHAPALPTLSPPYDGKRSLPTRLVLLAYDSRLEGEMLGALREFAAEGCHVMVVSPEPCGGLPSDSRLKVSNVVGDPLNQGTLEAAAVAAADAVILTGTDGLPADEADAHAVGTALLLQQLLTTDPRVSGDSSGPRPSRPLTFVCSLQDPQNRSVLQHIGVEACRTAIRTAAVDGNGAASRGLSIEVIEPQALISGMLAQVGAEPLLVSALEDLLDEEGCEIYLKRCDRYGMAPGSRVSWAQITEIVRQEDDVALGFLHRGRLHLAPAAEEELRVVAGDKLVVLSEAFL